MGVVTKMMMIRQVLLALVVFSVSSKRSPKIGLKGAARSACGCQCSDLVWQDKYGTVHGNCRSADHTKAKWCYVKEGSTCSDLVPSARHPRNPWSYQACATPTQRRCGGSSSGFSSNLGGNGRGQAGGPGSGGSEFRKQTIWSKPRRIFWSRKWPLIWLWIITGRILWRVYRKSRWLRF